MTDTETKEALQRRLAAFERGQLANDARALFAVLGYRSEKRFDLAPNTATEFRATFDTAGRLNPLTALLDQWQSVDVLFQLTDEELRGASGGQLPFAAMASPIDNTIIQSYLFVAIGLERERYTRTQLAGITREVNKLFPMPVLILFRHGQSLTFAVINRRLNKKDADRDVLEKVTLIKDIAFAQPHRAHLEILFDLSLDELAAKHGFTNFVELHRAWQKTLDTSELNKKFFREVANWYYWAVDNVTFPPGAGDDPETCNAVSVIRLITRLIFVWFIKEKGLVPPELFDKRALDRLLKWNDARGSTYYKAILQNLFFATLNTDMERDKPGSRRFRGKNDTGRDAHYGITSVYRYQDHFTDPDAALALFANVPFLNGGLFECLDRAAEGVRIDGFSDRPDNPLIVPDYLFFGSERKVDLNEVFATRNKQYEVCGLLRIFDRYKFTIEENTPIEEEIALDPELLGKVFENLLAAYNPETGATARKQTGSFYTPRPIVEYMVDESLLAYLHTRLRPPDQEDEDAVLRDRLADLLAFTDQPHGFNKAETSELISAIDGVKVLDPAAGSGAFPMGVLHKLVYLLGKLDPGNAAWRERQIEKASDIPDVTAREAAIASIDQVFSHNYNDYGRKLYLIENCIYGVDIQPIAVQIAKLRFFISLVVDQKIEESQPNRGIRPLPNLETKFVTANTLIGIPRPQQMAFRNPAIEQKEGELAEVRRRHFGARTQATKEKYREQDRRLRGELAGLLQADGWGASTASQLAAWDPYDQNACAGFFDPEWMFGVTEGFDVVIGNPPYVRPHKISPEMKFLLWQYFRPVFEAKSDLYACFIQKSIELLRLRGVMTFIVSKTWLSLESFEALRKYILSNTSVRLLSVQAERAFESATVETIVVVFERQPSERRRVSNLIKVDRYGGEGYVFDKQIPQVLFEQTHLHTFDLSLDDFALDLNQKMQHQTSPLDACVRFFYGLKTGDDSMFVHRSALTAQHKKLLRRSDFVKYATIWKGEYVWYVPAMMTRHRQTARPGDPDRFESPKILVQDIGKGIVATFDDQNYYVKDALLLLARPQGPDLRYVLGILNSRLIDYYYGKTFTNLSVAKNAILTLPIRILKSAREEVSGIGGQIITLVDRILTAKRANPSADVRALEAEIDRLVYALYGLTPDEIRIVEEGAR